jgi:hypothetical protein
MTMNLPTLAAREGEELMGVRKSQAEYLFKVNLKGSKRV